MNRRKIAYWLAQLFGWGLYTTFLTVSVLYFGQAGEHQYKVVALQVVIGLAGLLVSHLGGLYIKRHGWSAWPIRKLVLRIIALCLLQAVAAQVVIHVCMLTFLNWQVVRPINWGEFPLYTFNMFVIYMVWSILYFGFHFFEESQRSKLDKLKTEKALNEAELIALKAQINPHFLFNSLNNIRAMILEDPMKARNMVSNLSDLLRYSIRFNDQEKVTIASELEIVKDYLALESVQYEQRLDFRLEIAEETLSKKIPPMIIQLLVENAVKHGISQLPAGGQVRIRTGLQEDDLIIVVENTGKLNSKESSGIGIRNALERIRILFAIDPGFELTETREKVIATLKLPATE